MQALGESLFALAPALDRLCSMRGTSSRKVIQTPIHSLGANVVVPGLERPPRDDIDSDTQKFFKILEQADVVKKGGAWLKVDQQV